MKRRIFVLLLVATVGLFAVHTARAATSSEPTFTPNVSIPGLFPEKGQTSEPIDANIAGRYIRALYVYFVGIVGVLAVVMIMYAGFLWITAAGNSSKITQAKEHMNGAVIGVILALTSFLLLQLINPQLVSLRIPFIQPVDTIVQSSYFCSGNPLHPPFVSPYGTQDCGVEYPVPDSASAASEGKPVMCLGDVCDPLTKGETVCSPLKDANTYKCISPRQACEREKPKGVSVDTWCPFINRLLAASKNPKVNTVGCAKTIDTTVNDVIAKDDCTAGSILVCDTNEVRVDCNTGATEARPKNNCWEKSKPASIDEDQGIRVTCESLSNQRPVLGADAVCCQQMDQDKITCADSQPPSSVEVSCASVNVTNCTKKCWASLYLRTGKGPRNSTPAGPEG